MKKIAVLFIIFSIGVSRSSLCDEETDAKSKMLTAIRTSPKCDERAIKNLGQQFKPDAEMIFESAKLGCFLPVLSAAGPGKDSTDIDATLKFFKVMGEAEKLYLAYLNTEFFPRAKGSIESGGAPYLPQESNNLGAALGGFTELSKTACNAKKLTRLKTSEICTQLSQVQEADNEMNRFNKIESDNEKKSNVSNFPSEACPKYFDVKSVEKELSREQEAGKISGFVNADKMHDYGLQIAEGRRQLDALQSNYKQTTGRAFDFKTCPRKFDQWAGTAIGTD